MTTSAAEVRPAVLFETDVGLLTIDLLRNRAGENFIKLCKARYYCNNLFYSIRRGFVAQTGDPTGTGKGGESVFSLVGQGPRFFPDLVRESAWHGRGLVCMASYGLPHTNASAFFIVLGDASDVRFRSLVGAATVVGRVVDGLETLAKLDEAIVDEADRPFRDIRLRRCVILCDPFPDPPGLEVAPETDAYAPTVETAPERLSVLDKDEDEGLDEAALESKRQRLIAENNAIKLEILGDLPSADFKPMENVLFVCKLNPATRSEDLELIFSRFGRVLDCEVIRDAKTQDSLQYAFVEFSTKHECEEAHRKMQNVVIDDRRIKVDFSQSTRAGPGRWGRRGEGSGLGSRGGSSTWREGGKPAEGSRPIEGASIKPGEDKRPSEGGSRRPRLDTDSSEASSSSSGGGSSESSRPHAPSEMERRRQRKEKKRRKKEKKKRKKEKKRREKD